MATLAQILARSPHAKDDPKNTYLISPSDWASVVQEIDPGGASPSQTTMITPYAGPYKGKTFALAPRYHNVYPGIGAGLDLVTGLPGAAAGTVAKSNPFGLNFGAVSDFLNFVGWILHPLNWLRLAEFIVGLIFAIMGIRMLTRGGGTPTARLTSLTRMPGPGGRIIRTAQGRRMGKYEGQREAARMEARQKETRSQRKASARERHKINLDARRNP